MEKKFVILVADKSRFVREFLQREFTESGYVVQLAANHRRMFELLDTDEHADLLVLDLNLPFTGGIDILMRLQNRAPSVPVVVYSMFTEYESHPVVMAADAFVEKDAGPVVLLRSVNTILKARHPECFAEAGNGEKHIEPAGAKE